MKRKRFGSKKGAISCALSAFLLSGFSALVMLVAAAPASAETTTFVREINYTLEQPISGRTAVVSAGEYLQLVYQLALGLVGIIAVVLIMFGGLLWVQAAGNEQQITSAKELIISAVVGLLIALLSYTILAFINPETLRINFSVSQIPIVDKELIGSLPDCIQAQFAGETCTVDGINQPCNEVQCGKKGFYNGDFCKGVSSSAEDCKGECFYGKRGYYCANTYCGEWKQKCKRQWPNEPEAENEMYRSCLCGYYEDLAEERLGIDISNPSVVAEDSNSMTVYNDLCGELRTQQKWEEDLMSQLVENSTLYPVVGATVSQYGWNCGFTCVVNLDSSDYDPLSCDYIPEGLDSSSPIPHSPVP